MAHEHLCRGNDEEKSLPPGIMHVTPGSRQDEDCQRSHFSLAAAQMEK